MSIAFHSDLVVASDGLVARPARSYTREKLHFLERFCSIFNGGMKNKWTVRPYLELLSGPGRYVLRDTGDELPGSPLVAASCSPGFTHIMCNDYDPAAVAALQTRMNAAGRTNVWYQCSDCNDAVVGMAQRLSRLRDSLAFCFIDPSNWQIRFDSVRRLTANQRIDLLILFHSGSMKRVADLPVTTLENLSQFFGDNPTSPRWRDVYEAAFQEGRSTSDALLRYYQDQLKELGYKFSDFATIKMNGDSGVPLYQMLFASRDPRGGDFWNKALSKTSSGQRRLLL